MELEREAGERRRAPEGAYERSRAMVRRIDRMSAVLFVVAAVAVLGTVNAGSSWSILQRNAGGLELFGLLRWAAVPAVIAVVVRRRQHDALIAAAQLALIIVGAEMLGVALLWPAMSHAGLSMTAMMGAGLTEGVSMSAAAIPIGGAIIWGVRHFGDRRTSRR